MKSKRILRNHCADEQHRVAWRFVLLTLCGLMATVLAWPTSAQTQTQTYSTPGTYYFLAPDNIGMVTVSIWGGGGRGAKMTTGAAGGGGGGGAYSNMNLPVVPGTTYVVKVGAGGNNTNVNGGESFWQDPALGKLVRAVGGNGVADNIPSGGLGGLATNGAGTTRLDGGDGANGDGTPNGGYGGGGGSSAGTALPGTDATGRLGAIAPSGGGNGGNGGLFVAGSSGNPGSPGLAPGGGGGGARRHTNWSSANPKEGGAGANGKVVVTWEPCPEITFTATTQDVECFESTSNEDLGRITITASGGTAPYLYSIDNGINWFVSNVFTGLNEGNYRIRVRDNSGCISEAVPEL